MSQSMRLAFPCAALLAILIAGCGGGSSTGDDDVAPDGGGDDDVVDEHPWGRCEGTPAWTGTDHVAGSATPPGGLAAATVPQLVSLGFDDNFQSDAIVWITDLLADLKNPAGAGDPCTFDGTAARASFYLTSVYMTEDGATEDAVVVKKAWHTELAEGNEIADHTHTHSDGVEGHFTVEQWTSEIQTCLDWITRPFDPAEVEVDPTKGIGVAATDIVGFRTPYLSYGDATFTALDAMGFQYDCSVEDGFQHDQDAGSFLWPYTLDEGSPGNQILVDDGQRQPIESHPGLWELPAYPVVIPPDSEAQRYGFTAGLRNRVHAVDQYFDVVSGKYTGLDYNLWILAQLTKVEFVATLEYTLDQHLAGNRTPMMFGAHPDLYSKEPTDPPITTSTYQERREAVAEFLAYALAKPEVRVVPNRAILEWLRHPVALAP